ncbi:MAG: FkbM family methyltransferase, partial [Bacteroidia bacterium]|nr:FkbM family methyltransferase [Bacteroidia bacterium]
EEIIEIAKKYIRPGTVALDIGGNFGQMAIIFSRLVGKEGKVYVFEAQDRVFDLLNKNIKANNCKNIITKNGAVYNVNDKTLIFPEPDITIENPYGANAINPKLSEGREVITYTIDSLNISEPISFMKVDIQGSDIFAMQGARDTIFKNKMPVIFEYEQQFQEQFGTSFQDYVDFVDEINYKFVETIMKINYLIVPK